MALALQKHSALEMATTTQPNRLVHAQTDTLDRGLAATQESAAKASAATQMRHVNTATADLMA